MVYEWIIRSCVKLLYISTAVLSLQRCNPPCLYYSNKTAINFIELKTNHTSTIISNQIHAVALEAHFALNQLFWSDVSQRVIKKIDLNTGHVTDVVTKDLGQVEGLAVDWVGGVLYWTDYLNERIEVAGLDGSNRMVLLSENHENPRDIAVDVHARFIFWTDWSPIQPRIERATMSGENRTVIIKDPKIVRWPNGITVDYFKNTIIWVDAYYDYVVSCNFAGGSIKVLVQSTHPFGIATFADALYWSDINSSTIYSSLKQTPSVTSNFGKLSSDGVYALTVLDSSVQPNGTSSCTANSGGCSHLCLQALKGLKCVCPNGISLQSDGKTCNKDFKKFVLLTDQTNKKIYQLPLDYYPAFHVGLPFQNLSHPIALDFDPYEEQIYWTDIGTGSISRAYTNGSLQEIIVQHNTFTPAGLAVDSVGRNIYWTDEGTKEIYVAKLDGSYKKRLFYEELDHPRDIVLDTDNGLMYWCDWGKTEKIEKATMDGNNRTLLVQTRGTSPLGLALDSDNRRLYWVASPGSLAFLDLDKGTTVQLLSGAISIAVSFGLTLDEKYLYWTDAKSHAVYRADKSTAKNPIKILPWLGSPRDVRAFNLVGYREAVQNPCYKNNGGCPYLCLLRPGGYSCGCPDHIQSDRTCKPSLPSPPHSTHLPSSTLPTNTSLTSLKTALSDVFTSASVSFDSAKPSNLFPSTTLQSTMAPSRVVSSFSDFTLSSTKTLLFPNKTSNISLKFSTFAASSLITIVQPSLSAFSGSKTSFGLLSPSASYRHPAIITHLRSTTIATQVQPLPVTATSSYLHHTAVVSQSSSLTASVHTTKHLQIIEGCTASPCMNGGTCMQKDSMGYTCNCMKGFAGKKCLFYVGNNTIKITFKMSIDEWNESVFKKSISKTLTAFCHNHDCSFPSRFHNVQIAQKRDTQPLVFDSDDVIVLGKPEPLSGTVNISTSVRTRQDSHAAVPRSVLCNFVKHSRKSVSRLMGNHPVLLINGQRIPSCVETLTTIEPPTTDSIPAGSGKVTSSFTQGIQAGLVIAVIAVLAIGGSLVCYFRKSANKVPHETLHGDQDCSASAFENPCYGSSDLARRQHSANATHEAKQVSKPASLETFQEVDFGCFNQMYNTRSSPRLAEDINTQKQNEFPFITIPLTDMDQRDICSKMDGNLVASFTSMESDFIKQCQNSTLQWKN